MPYVDVHVDDVITLDLDIDEYLRDATTGALITELQRRGHGLLFRSEMVRAIQDGDLDAIRCLLEEMLGPACDTKIQGQMSSLFSGNFSTKGELLRHRDK